MFPDESIVATVSRQLSWSHFVLLLALKEPTRRRYYAQMAGAERWSVRTLCERIDSMLYERTALSKESGKTIARELAAMRDAQRMSPALVMRDPYILDFLGLRDTWQEGGPIHVAEYLTTLPPRGVLVERLHQATQRAKLQIGQRKADNRQS